MLKIYCINLEKRSDRWDQILANFQTYGLPASLVQRWTAVADTDFGALGCAKSHVAVLSNFLTNHSEPYCLVLEDDFDFVRPWNEFVECFNSIAAERIDWDVLLLAGTSVLAMAAQSPGLARVVESQSTVGYFVNRKYAARLLGCFAESIPHMEGMHGRIPQTWLMERFSIDQTWKKLQRRDHWYIFSSAFGRQRPGYSDIENREVNYDNLTYGLKKSEN
jgi:glycosyl transferase family 25